MTNVHMFRAFALALIGALVLTVVPAAGMLRAEETPIDPPVEETTPEEVPAPPDTESEEPAPAVVETGDADATSESTAGTNTNDITTPDTVDVVVDIENEADTDTSTTAEADTGDNTASGEEGSAYIGTGDAYASATSINVVNTNIINSNGLLFFLDMFSSLGFDMRTLDLSFFFGGTSPGSSACAFYYCTSTDLSVAANNTASTTNTMVVRADTGGNTATGEGDALIETGNAYASGNAVNVVNSNIIESNYLLIGINNFGELLDDITLPNEDFFRQLLLANQGVSGPLTVNATNSAQVSDNVLAEAGTGSNTATYEGEEGAAEIYTGDAIAGATSYNEVNSTLIGGTQIFFLFRIWGNWGGDVHGLPEGMTWVETPYGIQIMNEDGAPVDAGALASGEGDEGGCCSEDSLDVDVENDAALDNNVSVYALTGENYAESEDGLAGIATGNAYASANSVNIVNTNIIGRNYLFAIFNIFGDWDGNIAFGHPDLWIGGIAETGNPTLPGSDVTYRFTITNNGDSKANDVTLSADFLDDMLTFADFEEGEDIEWDLGDFAKGETKELSVVAKAGDVPDNGSVAVPLTATVTSKETDNNEDDNTEELTVVIMNPQVNSSRGGGANTGFPGLTVTKTSDVEMTTAPGSVDYTITIRNDGGNAYNAVVTDVLQDPDGTTIEEQQWSLDTVRNGEEVTITYTVEFNADAKPGLYENTVTISGNMRSESSKDEFNSVSTSYTVEVGGGTCPKYLTEYLKDGAANNPDEVKKLQVFLIEHEGEEVVTENGVYDSVTIAAVHRFQTKHLDEILRPWGANASTGFVYYTTQKKINDLYCRGERDFPLSGSQEAEIERYKGAIGQWQATQPADVLEETPLPPGVEVGSEEVPALAEEETPAVAEAPKAKGSWYDLGTIEGALSASKNMLSSMMAGAGIPFLNLLGR